MYYNDFNIVSGKADSKLFFDEKYQNIVNDAIWELLDREPLEWVPDTLWIDADANTLHMWVRDDREHTERTMLME